MLDLTQTPPQETNLGSGALDDHPTFSLDGTRIAVESRPAPGQGDIWIVDVASKQRTRITTTGNNFRPVWSPYPLGPHTATESRIAFVSTRDGNKEIYVMKADGSEQKNLTNHPKADDNAVWR